MKRSVFILFAFFFFGISANTQNDSTLKLRKTILITGGAILYTGSITALYSIWYKDYPSSTFHSFNDNAEWQQMDKCGHLATANISGALGYNAMRWAGYSENKSLWIGGSLGWLYLLSIEMMDGINAQWGFSMGDITANTAGSLSFILQQKYWHEQRLNFKVSVHSSPLAEYRPDLLGKNKGESLIKDYNGQTYWLSVNPRSFAPACTYMPHWLNLALGYGAYGMLGGRTNPPEYLGKILPIEERYRRVFISPDISLSRIPVKSKTLKTIFQALDFIKFPLPTLEYNKKNGFLFRGFYF